MPVTQNLMKPGSFSVRMKPDYGWKEVAAGNEFDAIVITETPFDTLDAYSDATLLSSAIYRGIVSDVVSGSFTGPDMSMWLGTEDGLGDLLDTAVTFTAGTLTQWVTALCPTSLTVGTITNTVTLTATYQWMSRREALDAVCLAVGAEWRVNPDGSIDVGPVGTLWPSSTAPTVIVTRNKESQDGLLRGLESTSLEVRRSATGYTTKVIAVTAGSGATVPVVSATGTTPYFDQRGNPLVMERLMDAPTDTSTNAGLAAAALLTQFNQPARELTLTSATYGVTRLVDPGDYVWAFDQLDELEDSANQIDFNGVPISPIKLRVYSLTWPIEFGMGVYLRSTATGSPVWTDLTPFVEWETSDVTWDVGIAPRAANTVNPATAGRTAYLGANAAVAERFTSTSPPASGSCALTATTTNPNLGATGTSFSDYHIVNGRCYWRAEFKWLGAGLAAGSGSYRISLPVPALGTTAGFPPVGSGWYYSSAGFKVCALDASPGASSARLIIDGGEVTAAYPAAPIAGSVLIVHGDYPIA